VAETGTVCVVESEGNGRMCLTLPEVLISVMGIEKLIPTWRDFEVFLQLLPRSSTGERMNPYTSFWTGVHQADGPREFHLVLLDNGRSRVLADRVGRQTLNCIRCSACLNVCPVKIDIPEVLVHLRAQVVEHEPNAHRVPDPEAVAMEAMAWVFDDRRRYELAQKLARVGQLPLARSGRIRRLPAALSGWTEMRDAPAVPARTFRDWWRSRR